ncbi:MAG: ABC transporter ATP-binding protein [Spirochaetaceae bacterium]|jgi:peptide/nickel transport system ATP-binding protein|nr:ABC transporter ATP-binding protein [Spirochaetaceae bacterium]
MMKQAALLHIDDLSVSFRMYDTALEQRDLTVISNLSLDVFPGEIVAVAGSSGSGKSLLAHAVMGLLPPNASLSGTMRYKGETLTAQRQETLRGHEIALVPQSVTFLDPLMVVGSQVAGEEKRGKEQKEIFSRLGLAPETARYYPFQLSGGMARRVLASTAMISGAPLIIADEPTPGMDGPSALEALRCFRALADKGKSVILITHDLDIAVGIADRLAVFYAGTTLETARAGDFAAGVEALRHPYSKALWEALPQNGFKPIPGFQPYAGELPSGCLFAPRCAGRTAECEAAVPSMRELRGGTVRCIHAA